MRIFFVILIASVSAFGQGLTIGTNYISLNGYTNQLSYDGLDIIFNGLPLINQYQVAANRGVSTVIMTNLFISNMPSGNNTIYTCPTGYRMMVQGATIGTTNSVTATERMLTNGTYYVLNTAVTTVATNASTALQNTQFVYEAGEARVVNTSAAGLHGVFAFCLFPTNVSCFSARNLALSSGNNTIYTAPSGKNAVSTTRTFGSTSGTIPLQICNSSGALRTYSIYLVPGGNSASVENILTAGKTVSDGGLLASGFTLQCVPAGYSVVVNSDSSASGQVCFLGPIIEVDQ